MHIRRAFASIAVAGLAVAAAACSTNDKPDAFVQATIKAAGGEPQALWKALPKSYQSDVQKLIVDFSGKMNDQIWNDSFVILQKATKVLETKKTFVLGYPLVQGLVKPEDMAQGIDPVVRTLGRIVNSDIATLEGLKKADVEKFLAGPIAASMEDITKSVEVAAAAAPKGTPNMKGMMAKLKAAKVTIESQDANSAKVKIEVEGEKPETTEMVKVEGKWLPKELVQAWPGFIAEARQGLEKVKIEPAMVVQFAAMKGGAEAMLNGLLAAKTQEEFNAQIDQVAGGLLGGAKPQAAKIAALPEEGGAGADPAAFKATTPSPKPQVKAKGKRRHR